MADVRITSENLLVKTPDDEVSVTVNSARELTRKYNRKMDRDENRDMDERTENVHNPFAGMSGPRFIIAVQNMTSAPVSLFLGNTSEPQIIEPEPRDTNKNNVSNEGNLTIGVCRVEYEMVKGRRVAKATQSKYTIEYEALFADPVYVEDIGAFVCIDKFRDWVEAYCKKESIVTCVRPRRLGVLTDYELRQHDSFIFSADKHNCPDVRSTVFFNTRNMALPQLFYSEDGKVRSTGRTVVESDDVPEESVIIRDEFVDEDGLVTREEEYVPITQLIEKNCVHTKSGRIVALNANYLRMQLAIKDEPFTPPEPDQRVPVEDMTVLIEKATQEIRHELETVKNERDIQRIANDKLKDSIKDRDTTIKHVSTKTADNMSKVERIFTMAMTGFTTLFKGADHAAAFSKTMSERKVERAQVISTWAKVVTVVAGAGLSVAKLVSVFA